MTFRHIALFRLHDDVSETDAVAALDALRSLGTSPGVLSWIVERSLDERKGRILVEDAVFVDSDAFQTFRATAAHLSAAAALSKVSDWWIGDYEIE